MSDRNHNYVACISLQKFMEQCDATLLNAIPGTSVDQKCSKCGTALVMAPSSQKLLRAGLAAAAFCYDCVRDVPGRTEVMTEDGLREYLSIGRNRETEG